MREAILVTSIGAKSALLERVCDARDCFDATLRIIGADTDISALGRYIVDEFWLMPALRELSFEMLLGYCKEHNVRYIIPTRDGELLFFAQHKKLLAQNNIFVFVCESEVVTLCYDKLKFYEKGDSTWCIPTSQDPHALDTKCYVIKERFGGGAQNIVLDVDKSTLQREAKNFQEPLFQPYIQGKEYSIDSYVDQRGKCRACIVRSRDKVIDGESKITTVAKKEDLAKKVANFVEKFSILGHSVTQVIEDQEGKYHLIECNTRFGGASTLSYELGLKSFLWFLQECNHQALDVAIANKKLTQVRVQKDLYFES
jgi:carbamoyl-phosphate synthase large subunit